MKKLLVSLLLLPATLLLVGKVHAQSIIVGSAVADHAGNLSFDILVDPNADPVYVADQLKANLELTNQASIQSVSVQNGIAHVSATGATPGATVQAALSNNIALATGVAPSPAGVETQRRAFWILGGLAGLAAIGGGDDNPPPPLAEEPPPTPTPAPPVSP
jgi:hypothetical protein